MGVIMVRAKIKAEDVAEVEAAVEHAFAAIQREQPPGVKYASCRLADGETFVVLLALDNDGDNPLSALPEFRAFQDGLQRWLAEPPTVEPLHVVGSYKLF
jgi:hypothetical protein